MHRRGWDGIALCNFTINNHCVACLLAQRRVGRQSSWSCERTWGKGGNLTTNLTVGKRRNSNPNHTVCVGAGVGVGVGVTHTHISNTTQEWNSIPCMDIKLSYGCSKTSLMASEGNNYLTVILTRSSKSSLPFSVCVQIVAGSIP